MGEKKASLKSLTADIEKSMAQIEKKKQMIEKLKEEIKEEEAKLKQNTAIKEELQYEQAFNQIKSSLKGDMSPEKLCKVADVFTRISDKLNVLDTDDVLTAINMIYDEKQDDKKVISNER